MGKARKSGKTRKCKARENRGGEEKFPPVFFFFVFALSQFRGPDYLGAWNRLRLK